MEFATAQVEKRGSQLFVKHGGDEDLIATFVMESVRLGAESEKAGRNIYRDVPFLWIRFPGDRTREVKRKASDADKARFPRQWAAFQNQQTEAHEGTPIEDWGPISKSLALTYKGLNIHTVENLAAVGDHLLKNLGHGAREIRDKARAWLKSAEGSAELLSLKSENDSLRSDIEMLKQQIAELGKKSKRKKDG